MIFFSHVKMAELVADVTQFEDVSKINSKESSSKLEEYFIEALEKGVEVIEKNPLCPFIYSIEIFQNILVFGRGSWNRGLGI